MAENELGGRRWSEVPVDELVAVELDEEERLLLWQGLHQWGGPTRPSDAIARVIGFADVEAMHADGKRIREAIKRGEPLTRLDWQRALVAIEIVWSSYFYGAAADWEIVAAGWSDERTLRVLRRIQMEKLRGLRSPPRRRANNNEGV